MSCAKTPGRGGHDSHTQQQKQKDTSKESMSSKWPQVGNTDLKCQEKLLKRRYEERGRVRKEERLRKEAKGQGDGSKYWKKENG